MNNWTITQRLNATIFLIIALAVASLALTWWLEREGSKRELAAAHDQEFLLLSAAHIRYDLLQRSDALRGLLLEPRSASERRRKLDADAHLRGVLDQVVPIVGTQPNLGPALTAITDLESKVLNVHESRLLTLVESDVPGATVFFNTVYLPARHQQEDKIEAFVLRVRKAYAADVRQSEHTQGIGVAFTVVMLGMSIVLGRYLAASIQQPLARLMEAMERLRGGDFTQRLALGGRDEFHVLAEGLNRMSDDLTSLVGRVQDSGAQVNTSAVEIATTARQQHTTAGEVATTTVEVRATSRRILTTSHDLVRTMGEVTVVVEETAALAGHSQEMLERMGGTMRQITAAATGINAKLTVLNEKAGNINQVVTTIAKVADQTNLLSLNAAIEAEKAGEYGRGFAVVASEIRRLADQTAEATFDIEQMVKEMQTAVSSGVMSMDKFTEEVRRGVAEVQQGGAQLAQIIQQVQALMPRFEAVNSGMQSQAEGAEQITEALAQLSDSSQQTVESLRQSAQAITRLNDAARSLQGGVSRFKLPGPAAVSDEVQP